MALTPDGLVDLRSLGPKNYTPLLLTRDPFPSIAIPEDFPAFTVDREELLEHFKDTLSTIQSNGSSSISVLKGEYGSGKTHLLKVLKTSVNKYLSSRTPRFFAIYAKSPGKSPPELYYSLIEDLGRAFLEEESKRIVTEYLLKIGDDAWGYLYSKDVKRNLNLKDLDLEEYLKNARTFDLYADVKSKSFGNLSNPDEATAFLLLSHPEYGSLAWRWFVGERLDKATRELFKLADNVDSEDAYSTIISLTQLLHLVGVEFIIFLVDEFEKLVKLSTIARGDYADIFLHYINDNPSKLGIFFAISPKECDVLLDESNAFT